MQQTTRSPSVKTIKEHSTAGPSKKTNFDTENVTLMQTSHGTKRHSSPSGCSLPDPKRKALGDITNPFSQSAAKKPLKQTNNNVQMELPIRRSERIENKKEKEFEIMQIEQSEQSNITGAQVNTFTIQPLDLDENERTSVEFKNKKGVFSPEYSQSDSDESFEGSPRVQTCIAYDHFGIFYYHMPSQETWELCLIVSKNMEDLNKHIEELKIPFKDVRCFAFAFKDNRETLKLKIIDPIPSGWKIIGQNKCQISKKSIAFFEKSKTNHKYPHVPDCRIKMGIKAEEAIVSFKMEGIISDKKDHTSIVKDIKSQQPCGSKNTSNSCGYNLRPRSYSASPKSNPYTAEPFDGQSSSQDSASRKLLVSSLRHHHSVICDLLFKNDTSLSRLKASLYSKCVIDIATKKDIGEKHDDVSRLMDYVSDYIEGGEGDGGIKRCEVVMKCFNDQEALRDIVKKMKQYRGNNAEDVD